MSHSFTHPIKAGEIIFTMTGDAYIRERECSGELTVSCDTDLDICILSTAGGVNAGSNGVSLYFVVNSILPKTIRFTATTKYQHPTQGELVYTRYSDASINANAMSQINAPFVLWRNVYDNTQFGLAMNSPLNAITGFNPYTSQTDGENFLKTKYKKETGNDANYLWWSSVHNWDYIGATYDATKKATLIVNTNCFYSFEHYSTQSNSFLSSDRWETNLGGLLKLPGASYWGVGHSYSDRNEGLAFVIWNGNIIIDNKFTFDVYLDGKTEPNIAFTWRKISANGSWSGQLTDIEAWIYSNGSAFRITDGAPPYPQTLYYPINNINVPNTGGIDDNGNNYEATYVSVNKNFDDAKYSIQWLNCDASIWSDVSKIERLLRQGLGGTDEMYLLLRFKFKVLNDNTDGWSALHIVTIPRELPENASDISVVRVSNSAYLLEDWQVSVNVHYGEMPEDLDPRDPSDPSDPDEPYDPYDPYNPPNPSDFEFGNGTITSGMLTNTYAMSVERLKALGSKLWSQSYFDVLKIQNNPIENIISVKAFPFSIPGMEKDIVIGNISMGVNGLECSDTTKLTVGSGRITGFYNNFLDFAPFTSLTIFLPFIGFKELDLSKLINTTLKVDYACDFITGACKAIILSDGLPVYEFDGTMGIDVPLTSSDRAQTDIKHLQNVVNGSAQLLNKDILGAVNTALSSAQMQYTSDTTSGGSPSCASYSCRNVYLIYNRPYFSNIASFNHVRGRASKKTATLSTLKGFTMTNRDIDLSGISCLSEEKDILRDLLSSGVYL